MITIKSSVMPPRSSCLESNDTLPSRPSQPSSQDELLSLASSELESMRQQNSMERSFPPACLRLFHSSSQQNHLCVDCGSSTDVTWASVSYGVTLCLSCSGRHRGLGVRCSYVKSLTLDSWNHFQVRVDLLACVIEKYIFEDKCAEKCKR
jgi:hypothetical protein